MNYVTECLAINTIHTRKKTLFCYLLSDKILINQLEFSNKIIEYCLTVNIFFHFFISSKIVKKPLKRYPITLEVILSMKARGRRGTNIRRVDSVFSISRIF